MSNEIKYWDVTIVGNKNGQIMSFEAATEEEAVEKARVYAAENLEGVYSTFTVKPGVKPELPEPIVPTQTPEGTATDEKN